MIICFFIVKSCLYRCYNSLRYHYVDITLDISHKCSNNDDYVLLTSSSYHPKILIKKFGCFLMPCHQSSHLYEKIKTF